MKTCTKCGETLPPSAFFKEKRNKDGLRSACKACLGKQNKSWRVRNNYDPSDYNKQYRKDNAETLKAKQKSYYESRKEKIIEANAAWAKAHPDKRKQYTKQHYQSNKAKRKHYVEIRRQKERQCTPLWLTKEQWEEMESFYWLAKDLQVVTGEPYEVDHIIPLSGETVCGLHVPWNLQVLPRDINRSKSNRLEPETTQQ